MLVHKKKSRSKITDVKRKREGELKIFYSYYFCYGFLNKRVQILIKEIEKIKKIKKNNLYKTISGEKNCKYVDILVLVWFF